MMPGNPERSRMKAVLCKTWGAADALVVRNPFA